MSRFTQIGNALYKKAFPLYRPLYSAFKSYTDRAERGLLTRQLSPGCVVVDAGANIGIYSQFLSRCVGTSGEVHSFEPSPENFARLQTAVAYLPNVRPNQIAVSDKTGEAVLYVSDDLNVDHRVYETVSEARTTLSIRSTTLDDYFKPGQKVDLIKIDIQGYELHALRGAKRVLLENPAIALLLEYWPYGLHHAGGSGEELLDFLKDNGFTAETLDEPGRRQKISTDSSDPTNYFNLFACRGYESSR